jgi:hypothetical protein
MCSLGFTICPYKQKVTLLPWFCNADKIWIWQWERVADSVAQIQFSIRDSPSLTRDLPFCRGNCLVSLPRLLTVVIKNTGDSSMPRP